MGLFAKFSAFEGRRFAVSRVMIDDVFFGIANSGIARVWDSVLRNGGLLEKAATLDLEIVLLNRSGRLNDLPVESITFADYSFQFPAQDRLLLDQVCRAHAIDVFVSTYCTIALSCKNLALVHDCIPEERDFAHESRGWMERTLWLLSADKHVCVSDSTARALEHFHPYLDPAEIEVAHNGVDRGVFYPRDIESVVSFRARHGLTRYLLCIGSRYQHGGYKNGDLLVKAMNSGSFPKVDLLFVGGEPITSEERSAADSAGVRVIGVNLDDSELAIALSGALALVYPSLCEGFGLPVLEALSCAIPVIVSEAPAVIEITGGLALVGSATSSADLIRRIRQAMTPSVIAEFRSRGPARAEEFTWQRQAQILAKSMRSLADSPVSDPQKLSRRALSRYTNDVASLQI